MEELLDLKQRLERERPANWRELPDIALYMDQIISYLPRQLIHFDDSEALTSAMVNNYIKEGLVPRASGKRYGPIHLGYLTAVWRPEKGAVCPGHRDPHRGGRGAGKDAGGAVPVLLRGPGPGAHRHRGRH